MSDHEQIEPLPSTPQTVPGASSPEKLLERFLREAANEAEQLQGLLCHRVAELWDVATALHALVTDSLAAQADQLVAIERTFPALDMLTKIHRQADRYLNVKEQQVRRTPK